MLKAIPTGISSFDQMRTVVNDEEYYFVDKSMLIKKLLSPMPALATLIARPRRFGKFLNMSMLECFLDIRCKREHLFDGLRIMGEEKV